MITNPTARKAIYGVYAGAAAGVGGISAYHLSASLVLPTELIGAQGVIAYVGALVVGLSLANTPSKDTAVSVAELAAVGKVEYVSDLSGNIGETAPIVPLDEGQSDYQGRHEADPRGTL